MACISNGRALTTAIAFIPAIRSTLSHLPCTIAQYNESAMPKNVALCFQFCFIRPGLYRLEISHHQHHPNQVLCISTSFRVLRAPESWSKHLSSANSGLNPLRDYYIIHCLKYGTCRNLDSGTYHRVI